MAGIIAVEAGIFAVLSCTVVKAPASNPLVLTQVVVDRAVTVVVEAIADLCCIGVDAVTPVVAVFARLGEETIAEALVEAEIAETVQEEEEMGTAVEVEIKEAGIGEDGKIII